MGASRFRNKCRKRALYTSADRESTFVVKAGGHATPARPVSGFRAPRTRETLQPCALCGLQQVAQMDVPSYSYHDAGQTLLWRSLTKPRIQISGVTHRTPRLGIASLVQQNTDNSAINMNHQISVAPRDEEVVCRQTWPSTTTMTGKC